MNTMQKIDFDIQFNKKNKTLYLKFVVYIPYYKQEFRFFLCTPSLEMDWRVFVKDYSP